MRGSSSELLLEASCSNNIEKYEDFKGTQEELIRRRKLLELGFGASRRRPPRRTCRQRFNFYATSALAFVATSGGAALLFLVPLYVDPAISTLAADFSPDPVICTTSRREDLAGLFNCTWSSCREGCTSDVYRCTHIYVTYTPFNNDTRFFHDNDTTDDNGTGGRPNVDSPINANVTFSNNNRENSGNSTAATTTSFVSSNAASTSASTTTSTSTSTSTSTTTTTTTSTSSSSTPSSTSSGDIEAVLMVNIKGCGYPPVVDCENFTKEMGYEGAKFPCHYSRVNGSIVMASYNREAQLATIMHFLAAPFVVTLATSVALCVMHCDCRCATAPPRRHSARDIRRHKANDLSDHSISNRVDRRGGHRTHCECGEVTRPL